MFEVPIIYRYLQVMVAQSLNSINYEILQFNKDEEITNEPQDNIIECITYNYLFHFFDRDN